MNATPATTPPSTIRTATAADLDRVVVIVAEAIRHMADNGILQWDSHYPDREILGFDIAAGHTHVIEEDQTVAGFVTVNEVQHEAYGEIPWTCLGRALAVHRLTIHPNCQGRRMASRLMDFVERMGQSHGYDVIRLDAFSLNPAALALYQHRGYRRAGSIPSSKGPFWCYEKPIGSG